MNSPIPTLGWVVVPLWNCCAERTKHCTALGRAGEQAGGPRQAGMPGRQADRDVLLLRIRRRFICIPDDASRCSVCLSLRVLAAVKDLLHEAASRVRRVRKDPARTAHGHLVRAALAAVAIARGGVAVARARDGARAVDADESLLAPLLGPAVADKAVLGRGGAESLGIRGSTTRGATGWTSA